MVDLFPRTLTMRRYVSANDHRLLTCSLERSAHIGHGYESSEACRDGMLAMQAMNCALWRIKRSNYYAV